MGARKFGFQGFNARLVLPSEPAGRALGVEHGAAQRAANVLRCPGGKEHIPTALVRGLFFGTSRHQRGPVHLLQVHLETRGFQLLLGHQWQLGDSG